MTLREDQLSSSDKKAWNDRKEIGQGKVVDMQEVLKPIKRSHSFDELF
jgi:hypothetical protein